MHTPECHVYFYSVLMEYSERGEGFQPSPLFFVNMDASGKNRTIGMLGFGGYAAKTQHTVLFLPELPI
jgi:hypothetical protein